jgi:hypothetical protein
MLDGRAKRQGKRFEDLDLDMEDIYILVREVYQWKCLVKGKVRFSYIFWADKKTT